jgi:hypothetical protein
MLNFVVIFLGLSLCDYEMKVIESDKYCEMFSDELTILSFWKSYQPETAAHYYLDLRDKQSDFTQDTHGGLPKSDIQSKNLCA